MVNELLAKRPTLVTKEETWSLAPQSKSGRQMHSRIFYGFLDTNTGETRSLDANTHTLYEHISELVNVDRPNGVYEPRG